MLWAHDLFLQVGFISFVVGWRAIIAAPLVDSGFLNFWIWFGPSAQEQSFLFCAWVRYLQRNVFYAIAGSLVCSYYAS